MKEKNFTATLIFPLLLALYEICLYLSNDAYLPALPHIVQDLQTSNHLVQLTLATWFMGSASTPLFLGPLTDKIGRRPILLSSGCLFAAAALGCVLTHEIDWLLFFRFIQGATVTAMMVAGYATIHELFDREKAIHTLSMMSAITVLAPSCGALFGALILQFSSWRMIFGVLAVWAVVVLIGLFFKMPETNRHAHEKQNIKKIIQQYKNIFTNRSFLLLLLTARCLFAAVIAWIAAGPFLLIQRFHFGAIAFGISQIFIFGGFIIGTRFVKLLMTTKTFSQITCYGIGVATMGALYALVTSFFFPHLIWHMVIAMMVISMASGLVSPIFERLGIESSEEPMGSKVAVSSLLMGISGTVGSLLVSGFYNNTSLSLGIILSGLCFIACVLRFATRKLFRDLST